MRALRRLTAHAKKQRTWGVAADAEHLHASRFEALVLVPECAGLLGAAWGALLRVCAPGGGVGGGVGKWGGWWKVCKWATAPVRCSRAAPSTALTEEQDHRRLPLEAGQREAAAI